MEDYYSILGVSKTATEKEIKSAYRKQALKWHPDKNKEPGAEDQFKKITKAYETLSDTKKRSTYDQLGHQAYEQYGNRAGGAAGGPQGGAGWGQQGPFTYSYSGNAQDFGFDVDPFEIFEQFFGGGGGSPFSGRARQRRQIFQIKLTFDEAVHGVEKETVIGGKTRSLKIPAGVDTGMRIRFDDFDVLIEVGAHEKFKREDQNVIVEQSISLKQAVLGDTIEVPTIDKPVKVKIKPGTQSNSMIRLKEKGIPHPQQPSRRGDQYIVLTVTIPKHVSKKAKKLIEELDQELS